MRRILLSCALFGLVACTVNSNPGPSGPQPGSATPTPAASTTPDKPATDPPPGAEGGESARTPTGTPPLPEGVVVAPRQPDKPADTQPAKAPAGASVECTAETRKGGMCTREFRPVCGSLADKTTKTYSNPCVACSDEKVTSYVPGECAAK